MSNLSSLSSVPDSLVSEHKPTPFRGAFKLQEARHYLGGLSTPTMYRLIERGLLKPNRSLRHLIFSRAELDRFLSES
jgi:hypothetical protein